MIETESCLELYVIRKKRFVGRISRELCDWMRTGWIRTSLVRVTWKRSEHSEWATLVPYIRYIDGSNTRHARLIL
jgi:hypothetical protein